MGLQHPLISLDKVSAMSPGPGISVRVAVSGNEGSSTMAVHQTFDAGFESPVMSYAGCDEIAFYMGEDGELISGGETYAVREGSCHFLPKGAAFQIKAGAGAPLEMLSFCLGAANPADTQPAMVEDGGAGAGATVLHLDDVDPANMDQKDGWFITDFRLPFGSHNGSESTLFRARFFPGAVHKKHRHENCEEIYHIISGHGLAGAGDDRVEVRSGDFHYIPAGTEHWLHNLSDSEPIEVIGVYIGAGSVPETGYVYMGDVTEADLAERTA